MVFSRPLRPPTGGTPRRRVRAGFSLLELLIVVTVLGIAMAVVAPGMGRVLAQHRLEQASMIVAGDLQRAFSVAQRQRQPLRLVFDSVNAVYEVQARAVGGDAPVVYQRRTFTADGGFGAVPLLFAERDTVEIFPSGIASDRNTITLGASGSTKQVQVSRVGVIRVVR